MTVARLTRSVVKPLASVALLTVCLSAQPIMAQNSNRPPASRVPNDKMVAIPIPVQPDAIALDTGPLPGATAPESWHSQYGSKFAQNVTVATLRPFLPDPSKATGAAVIDVPADAPPLFAAIAADDPLFSFNVGLIENWRKAHRPVEFHYYEQGGHGFGMYPKETTSTGWFDAFSKWLGMHGYLRPKT